MVRIGSDLSDPFPLTVGVAQESILGPVLFMLYVNDLLSVPKKCEAMGYVDDTKLLLTLPPSDISIAISDLNSDLREIAKWCSTNSLLINPNKTKLLVVGVPQLTRNLSLPPVFLLGKEARNRGGGEGGRGVHGVRSSPPPTGPKVNHFYTQYTS